MTEQILVYLLAADLSHQLRQMLGMKMQQLQKKPGDIQLTADISKIRHDISEISRIVNTTGEACVGYLTKIYNAKFQFMVPDGKKEPPRGVDGKEIKLN